MKSEEISDYRSLFFEFISLSGYSAANVRLIRSDVNKFLDWCYFHQRDPTIKQSVEDYLVHVGAGVLPIKTHARVSSNIRQFQIWTATTNKKAYHSTTREAIQDVVPSTTITNIKTASHRKLPILLLFLVIIIPTTIFVYRINSSPSPTIRGNNPYLFTFRARIRPHKSPFTPQNSLTFTFYDDRAKSTILTRSSCQLILDTQNKSEITLQVNFAHDCSSDNFDYGLIRQSDVLYLDVHLGLQRIGSYTLLKKNERYSVFPSTEFDYQIDNYKGRLDISNELEKLPESYLLSSDSAYFKNINKKNASLDIGMFDVPSDVSLDGFVVSLDGRQLRPSTLDDNVIGVVSGSSIITSGIAEGVASPLGSEIQSGDPLVLDIIPGMVRKYDKNDDITAIIGHSLENTPTKSGRLLMYFYGK